MKVEVGQSPSCGPAVGQRVVVKEPAGAPVYPLPAGLHAGDVVTLLHFDHGWWNVLRETDQTAFQIYLIHIDAERSVNACSERAGVLVPSEPS